MLDSSIVAHSTVVLYIYSNNTSIDIRATRPRLSNTRTHSVVATMMIVFSNVALYLFLKLELVSPLRNSSDETDGGEVNITSSQ
jgi:NADH:ubiquinone oxidoreductase subunit 2 (subunit N)